MASNNDYLLLKSGRWFNRKLTYESSDDDESQRTRHHGDRNEWTESMLIQNDHF